MPSNLHNDNYCRLKKENVTLDDKGKCSLCGSDVASVIFEDSLVYLLKKGALYAVEPKSNVSYKTEYRNALEVKKQ